MISIIQNIINFFNGTKRNEPIDHEKYYPGRRDYSRFYNPDNIFTDEFYTNLSRTIKWTEKIIADITDSPQINFTTVLRVTNPAYNGKPFYNYPGTALISAATPEISFNYAAVLQDALAVRELNDFKFSGIDELGQILEFDIDLTTHDGAPCICSDGFVDESDIPPIDTWFFLTRTKLYCWIPNLFIDKMQSAIDVEILDSYRWVKDSNPFLQLQVIDKLRSA